MSLASIGTLLALFLVAQGNEAQVGKRPYELDWAGRVEDDHPPLVDFEDLEGWRVEPENAQGDWSRTREQQIWGEHVGRLVYRGTGPNPVIRLRPPRPIPIADRIDAVTMWVYGNNWGYAPDPKTPPVSVSALFTGSDGAEFSVPLDTVNWTEWFLMHRRLEPSRAVAGSSFTGIEIRGGRNAEDRTIYLDNLAVFQETLPPLSFEPRPERGIPMFPGQTTGTNSGPGKLPFPTRHETILPDNLETEFTTNLTQEGADFLFRYSGKDGELTYRLSPASGTWGDLSALWKGAGGQSHCAPFRPCVEGGVYLHTEGGPSLPTAREHLGTSLEADMVTSRWKLAVDTVQVEVTYRYRLWKKSLVIDVQAPGGAVSEVRLGRAEGLRSPRLVTNPFYPVQGGRPAVVVSGTADDWLFLTGQADWYLSNASVLWATSGVDEKGSLYNGGTRYIPKTDGMRNNCFERVFLTVTPRYEETLPTVANLVSPWKSITGTRVWRAHGASDRKRDAEFWRECHRWGMTQVVVTDHETGWRDGGESFTFRTRPAPGKGGNEGQFQYARIMQDELGFVYGPYNNFTDFAPVNQYWSTDLISRTPENQLQGAWMRCYAPKPARAVEYCAKLAPIIEDKFHFSTAYCDVHTAVAPWDRVDYDARVPGAGTFAAVFYSFGEIMLLQKQAWGGPVYSEGNNHAFYCGLTDGNYGQDQPYRPATNPWLVDFDLRKLHDLCCNFGMGNPDMFYAGAHPPRETAAQRDAWLDRFLAATVAFGHPGFLTYEGGVRNALRSYYMLQQLQSRYCLSQVSQIRYLDAGGRALDTSAAVASGAFNRSQVAVAYADGTIVAANGHPTERMNAEVFDKAVDLPPNGYAGWSADGAVVVESGDRDGSRFDSAETPAYLFVDGRGRFVRRPRSAGNGLGICRALGQDKFEVLLYENAECGFAVPGAAITATALGRDGKELGPATVRRSRGLVYVLPVQRAFSYAISGTVAPAPDSAPIALSCPRDEVYPGEQVVVRGREEYRVSIPLDAQPGQRHWVEKDGSWIDFTIVPVAKIQAALSGDSLVVSLQSNKESAGDFTVEVSGESKTLELEPGAQGAVSFDLPPATTNTTQDLQVKVKSGESLSSTCVRMRVALAHEALAGWPSQFRKGFVFRNSEAFTSPGRTGAIVDLRSTTSGGETRDSLFMHPPYMGGTGHAFALFEAVPVPEAAKRPMFRAVVGKGDGSDPGDGIVYKIVVVANTQEVTAGEQTVKTHAWTPIEADLSPWAGQTVAVKLVADVGPADNSSGDWGCWSGMRLESKEQVFLRSLEDCNSR